jgi:predicted ATP-dependent protease
MKVTYVPDKVTDNISDRKLLTQLISSIEANGRTPSLDTLAMAEFVKQRRRDALRISEITLRAITGLSKQ